ncbi:hypothetical protein T484DRAFT_2095407 [Baffinella frigidus]|nr:hypothetical protein T484DRAFT_2095407 [Cryptophyta sp. CCMP2293]
MRLRFRGMAGAHFAMLIFFAALLVSPATVAASPSTAYPSWLSSDPATAVCTLGATWEELSDRRRTGNGAPFETGGLGGLTEAPRFWVWVCEEGHACAYGTSLHFCFVFDEVDKVFLPWGGSSLLPQLGLKCPAGSYNDGVAACTTCPIGYTSTAASTAASDCTFSACPAGFTGDEGHGCNATVRALSLGDYFTCAQNATLALKCWGYGGSLGDGTTVSRLTPVDVEGLDGTAVVVASGGYHSCASMVKGGRGRTMGWVQGRALREIGM